jgi:hypothetical protein
MFTPALVSNAKTSSTGFRFVEAVVEPTMMFSGHSQVLSGWNLHNASLLT